MIGVGLTVVTGAVYTAGGVGGPGPDLWWSVVLPLLAVGGALAFVDLARASQRDYALRQGRPAKIPGVVSGSGAGMCRMPGTFLVTDQGAWWVDEGGDAPMLISGRVVESELNVESLCDEESARLARAAPIVRVGAAMVAQMTGATAAVLCGIRKPTALRVELAGGGHADVVVPAGCRDPLATAISGPQAGLFQSVPRLRGRAPFARLHGMVIAVAALALAALYTALLLAAPRVEATVVDPTAPGKTGRVEWVAPDGSTGAGAVHLGRERDDEVVEVVEVVLIPGLDSAASPDTLRASVQLLPVIVAMALVHAAFTLPWRRREIRAGHVPGENALYQCPECGRAFDMKGKVE